ncbi:MAG: PKD domain-containing protein [Deltaproteobacteria bacterium]|nr:PKD domain-containing protein [Deltaproteobacteria bacterium]
MNPVSSYRIIKKVFLLTITLLAFGCSGGGGGGGIAGVPDNGSGSTENALGLNITSPESAITVESGEAVTFTGTVSSGTSPYSFEWDFGNAARKYQAEGTTPPEKEITFGKSGPYTVTLTATDDSGSTARDTVSVTVLDYVDTVPVARFLSPSTDPVTIQAGQSLDFQTQVQGGNRPFTFSLDFPDNVARDYYQENALTPPNLSITFNTAGTFDVTFKAIDEDNDEHSDTVTVIVQ